MRSDLPELTPSGCPNPQCAYALTPRGWHFKRFGFYTRQCQPQRIQRYRCCHCGRTFSTQTFSPTYWLRRPDLLRPLFYRVLACSGFRQIAREFAVAHTTVLNQVARLGRHCLLFQHRHRPPPTEPLVLDGFESFEFSQYFPCHFHVVVGQRSHFFYGFTDSPLRRKGRMTPHQRHRRHLLEQQLGRPDPKSIEKEVAEVLRLVCPPGLPIDLHLDDHPAYPRALRRLPSLPLRARVTSSLQRRTSRNPLFPVNLLDLLIRHGSANHKRETIAFSKRRQSAIERLAILQVWRNFIKPFSERRAGGTPAQRLGICDRALTVDQVLATRLRPHQVLLPPPLERYYRRWVPTAAIPHPRTHRLSYAD